MAIIDKLKGLKAKAESTTNVHEAEVFLAKLFELLERHQLELGDLETDDPVGCHHKKETSNGSGDWPEFLFETFAAYLGCRVITTHGHSRAARTRHVYGRESAVIALNEMHPYLCKTVRALARENAGVMSLSRDKAARRIGNSLVWRICDMTARAKEPGTQAARNALVAVDLIKTLINADFQNLREGRTTSINTSAMGRDLANGISLNSQVKSNNTLKLT